MPTFVGLEQLLNIALTTPEVGSVNFNILRVFLQEILKHLNIENKAIDIDILRSDLKSAYDFIRDGYVEIHSRDGYLEVHSRASSRTSDSAERGKVVVEEEPEEQIIEEQGNEEGPKSTMPALVVKESKSPTSERVQEPEESTSSPKPGSAGLSVKDQPSPAQSFVSVPGTAELSVKDQPPSARSFQISVPASGGLSVKDQPSAARSAVSVTLIGRRDSLKNLKKMVSELQERVESLETQPAPIPDPVRSAASLVRRESTTPAHDFVELINIKRRLEASENSMEGLTEMVDALTSDMNELKELLSGSNNAPSDVISEMEELKSSLNALKEVTDKQDNTGRRIDEFESILANLKEAMENLTNTQNSKVDVNYKDQGNKDIQQENSEALQKFENHESQLQALAAQIQEIEVKIEGNDKKFRDAEQAASDALMKLEACGQGVGEIKNELAALSKELKNQKSLIEDNEMQIHQLKNTMTLLQRVSLEQANKEAEKVKEDEKVLEPAETPVPRRRTYSTDRDELSLIRTMISDLQEEKDKLKQADVRLSDELYRKQKHLDDLYNLVDELKDVKVDKELLSVGFELKADKREVDAKVGREDFEHYMSLVDQSLRDLLQRLDGHEDALKQALDGITSVVGKKLDKEDVEPLKHYLEARMEAMKLKPVEKPPPDEFAAGIRKQFLVNHNCISCDRPVRYAREEAFPPLPTIQSMPGSKSNRPYTTFELEQIRQHMLQGGLGMTKERFELLEKQRTKLQKEILRLSGVRDLQELAEVTARACGGVHTLTYPHNQAVVRGLQLNRGEFDFLVPQKDFQPVDILGQDGHIYKGLLETLPPTLPHIPQKTKSPGLKNPQRSFRRSTTPTSANPQKTVVDDPESS